MDPSRFIPVRNRMNFIALVFILDESLYKTNGTFLVSENLFFANAITCNATCLTWGDPQIGESVVQYFAS